MRKVAKANAKTWVGASAIDKLGTSIGGTGKENHDKEEETKKNIFLHFFYPPFACLLN